jgi:hypothetical protein
MHCNNAARGHNADRSKTPHCIFGNGAAEEQLCQDEQVHKDDPRTMRDRLRAPAARMISRIFITPALFKNTTISVDR